MSINSQKDSPVESISSDRLLERVSPEHQSKIAQWITFGALEHYTPLQILLLEYSWRLHEAEYPEGVFDISHEVTSLLLQKSIHKKLDISFSHFLAPSEIRGSSIAGAFFCRNNDDTSFFPKFSDICEYRFFEEAFIGANFHIDPEKINNATKKKIIDFGKKCSDWLESQFAQSLHTFSPNERNNPSLHDFVKMTYGFDQLLRLYFSGATPEHIFETLHKMDFIDHLDPIEKLKICKCIIFLLFTSYASRVLGPEFRNQNISPEKLFAKMNNNQNYEFLLEGRVTMDTSSHIPIFYIHDKNIFHYLTVSDRYRGAYFQKGYILILSDKTTCSEDQKEVREHELHHFLYYLISRDMHDTEYSQVQDEVLAFLSTSKMSLQSIESCLSDKDGAYRFDQSRVGESLKPAQYLLEAGIERRFIATFLLLIPGEKWGKITRGIALKVQEVLDSITRNSRVDEIQKSVCSNIKKTI